MKNNKNTKTTQISSKNTPAQSRIHHSNQTAPLATTFTNKNTPNANEGSQKNKHYLNLTNQQFLIRNLKLLGISQQQFLKQTKVSLSDSSKLFPKSLVNPTASKQFFFISFTCLQHICNKGQEQLTSLSMWYPPRTVNEQLQFKKALFKVIQNLQIFGKLPKNLLVSRGTIMGDSSSATLVEFLRILSQMALRCEYIEKYSKRQRLVQIACGSHQQNKPQNDINRFYVHPFVPNGMEPPSNINLDSMKSIYQNYIKIYLRKLIQLRTKTINEQDKFHVEHQNAMKNFLEQKQLHQTLSQKMSKKILSQNRSFDRRRIIDQNTQIWEQLSKIECNYIEKSSIPILKIQGQIDFMLKKWEPVQGISNILEANSLMNEKYAKLKSKSDKQLKQFFKIKEHILKCISKAQ